MFELESILVLYQRNYRTYRKTSPLLGSVSHRKLRAGPSIFGLQGLAKKQVSTCWTSYSMWIGDIPKMLKWWTYLVTIVAWALLSEQEAVTMDDNYGQSLVVNFEQND